MNINTIEIIGWLGAIFLTLSSIPQMIQSIKKKNSDGISSLFIVLITAGAFLSVIYSTYHNRWPLVVDHVILTLNFIIIGYYKLYPKK